MFKNSFLPKYKSTVRLCKSFNRGVVLSSFHVIFTLLPPCHVILAYGEVVKTPAFAVVAKSAPIKIKMIENFMLSCFCARGTERICGMCLMMRVNVYYIHNNAREVLNNLSAKRRFNF